MPNTRFFIVTDATGQAVDAGAYDPEYSWNHPPTDKLQPGDTLKIGSRDRFLTADDEKTLDAQYQRKRIEQLRAQLAELEQSTSSDD